MAVDIFNVNFSIVFIVILRTPAIGPTKMRGKLPRLLSASGVSELRATPYQGKLLDSSLKQLLLTDGAGPYPSIGKGNKSSTLAIHGCAAPLNLNQLPSLSLAF